jgi:Sulfatase
LIVEVVILGFIGVVVQAAPETSPAVSPSKPNIIFVMPDDAGYGDYASLGNPIMRSPSVDAFKQESLLFTQFHVSPTCSPCRSALMSGRHEFKNGVTHTIGGRERMALSTFPLPQMLKSVGYTTGIFGKWHLGDEAAYRPESRGFDEVYIHGSGGIGQGAMRQETRILILFFGTTASLSRLRATAPICFSRKTSNGWMNDRRPAILFSPTFH